MGYVPSRRAMVGPVLVILLACLFHVPGASMAKPPDVLISYPVDGAQYRASEWVTLDASASFDPEGKGLSFYWRSNRDGDLGFDAVKQVRLSPGSHTITCTVTDGDQEEASETRQVTILPLDPPIADLKVDKTFVEVYEIVTFDASRSSDPDFGIFEYKYTYGDGEDTGWIKSNVTSHSYDFPGIYKARLDVKDNDGLTDSSNITITVRGRTKVSQPDNSFVVTLLIILMVVIVIMFILIIAFRRMRLRRIRAEEEQLQRRIDRKVRRAQQRRGEGHGPSEDPFDEARKVRQAKVDRGNMRTGRMTDLGPRPRSKRK